MNDNLKNIEKKEVDNIIKTLHIELPMGDLPFVLKIIAFFTLIGGFSIIGSLFVDIGSPKVNSGIYLLRLLIGILAIMISYGLVQKKRWTLWAYGFLTFLGLFFNPIASLLPFIITLYLYKIRKQFKPSLLDTIVQLMIKGLKK